MLPDLSGKVNIPIIIVQHMPAGFTRALAISIDLKCRHSAVECADKSVIKDDHIYIAPGGPPGKI